MKIKIKINININANTNNPVSILEASQNFSKVARLADEQGAVIIQQNDAPRYVLMDYRLVHQNTVVDDAVVDAAAEIILKKHIKAFEALAK